jgi:hypothetical protein
MHGADDVPRSGCGGIDVFQPNAPVVTTTSVPQVAPPSKERSTMTRAEIVEVVP